jgi:hypothetical protein
MEALTAVQVALLTIVIGDVKLLEKSGAWIGVK